MLRARHRLAMLAGLASIGAIVVVMGKQAERVGTRSGAASPEPKNPRTPPAASLAPSRGTNGRAPPSAEVARDESVRPRFRIKVVDAHGNPCPGVRVRLESTAPPTSFFRKRRLDLETGSSDAGTWIDLSELVTERIDASIPEWLQGGVDTGPPRAGIVDDTGRPLVPTKVVVDEAPWILRVKVPASEPPTLTFDPFAPPESPVVLNLPQTGSMTIEFVGRDGEVVDADVAVHLLAWPSAKPALETPADDEASILYEDDLDAIDGRIELPHVAAGMQLWLDGSASRRTAVPEELDLAPSAEQRDPNLQVIRCGSRRERLPDMTFGQRIDGPSRAGEHVEHSVVLPIGSVRFTGSIADSRGKPVRFARVTLRPKLADENGRSLARDAPPAVIDAMTDATGHFDESASIFGALPPGIAAELSISDAGRILVMPVVGATSSDQRTVDFGVVALAEERRAFDFRGTPRR